MAKALAPPDSKARGLLEDEDTSSRRTGAACSAQQNIKVNKYAL